MKKDLLLIRSALTFQYLIMLLKSTIHSHLQQFITFFVEIDEETDFPTSPEETVHSIRQEIALMQKINAEKESVSFPKEGKIVCNAWITLNIL